MNDPMDTDATAGLTSLDVDLLRKDVAFWIEQSDIWKRLANDERDVTERLRAVIENAPHDLAKQHAWHGLDMTLCRCWKADAL